MKIAVEDEALIGYLPIASNILCLADRLGYQMPTRVSIEAGRGPEIVRIVIELFGGQISISTLISQHIEPYCLPSEAVAEADRIIKLSLCKKSVIGNMERRKIEGNIDNRKGHHHEQSDNSMQRTDGAK